MRSILLIGLALGVAACEPDDPQATTTAETDTSDDSTAPDDSIADVEDVDTLDRICLPSRWFCTDPRTSAECSSDGKSIANTIDCVGASACDPNTGQCAAAICEPESTNCLSLDEQQICKPDGSGYGPVLPCEEPLFCAQGLCRACNELEVQCLSDTTYRRCAADAQSWSDTLECQTDYRCAPEAGDSPAACKRCGFEAVCLSDSRVRTRCTSGEIDFQEDITCPIGTTCMEGSCRACEPDRSQCLSETSFRACAEDGSAWSAETACPEGEACFVDKCLPYGCSPRVLFLVDYSGSMSPHWDAVAASVETIVAENPEVRFGLKTFPDASSSFCEVGPGLTIEFGVDQAEAFDTWFALHDPPGATPLAAGMTAVADNAAEIFGPLGGYVIVLSDGEDSCFFGSETPIRPYLAETTARLLNDHKVQTFGIAYAFGGAEAGEMDTIARNGGTGENEAVDAGNESELTAAFDKIIDKVKFCDQADPDPPASP